MLMDPALTLSNAELDELAAFLESDVVPAETMDIAMLDGYLTALLIGPAMPTEAVWLEQVWGNAAGAMSWQSAAQEHRVLGLVRRHLNGIAYSLETDPRHYVPLLMEEQRDGRRRPVLDEWCSGFVHGMALDEAVWAPLMNAEGEAEWLTPILLWGTEPGWQQLDEDAGLAARHDEFVAALPDCVRGIRAYWRKRRAAEQRAQRAAPVAGRNDPCPCGSGRKFKKCCGATANA
jgi:uncharacterized protein